MELAHWNRLLNQLPKKQLRRLDNLLRRSLARGLLPAQPGSSAVPEEMFAAEGYHWVQHSAYDDWIRKRIASRQWQSGNGYASVAISVGA